MPFTLLRSLVCSAVTGQPVSGASAGAQLGTTGYYDMLGGTWSVASNVAGGGGSIDIQHAVFICSAADTGAFPEQQVIAEVKAWTPSDGSDIPIVLRWQDANNFYEGIFFGTAGQLLLRKFVAGVQTDQFLTGWDTPPTPGHDFRATCSVTGSTFSFQLLDLSTSTALLSGGSPTRTATDASISGAGRCGVSSYHTVSYTRIDVYGSGTASFVTSPSSITAGTTPGGSALNSVEAVGTNTSWSGATVFTLTNSGGTNAAIVGQGNLSATGQCLTIDAGTVAGTVTLSDGSITETLTIAAPAPVYQVVFNGDSIMAGQGLSPAQNIAGQALRYLGPQWKVANLGVSGHTVLPGGGQIPWAAGFALFDGSLTRHAAVLQGGDNDFAAGATPAQVYAGFKVVLAEAKAAGFPEVYLLTILPYPAAYNAGIAAAGPVFNALARANWAADGFTALIDVAALQPFANQAQVNNNPAYFQGPLDPHPTAAADAILGAVAAAAIAAAGVSGGVSGGGPRLTVTPLSVAASSAGNALTVTGGTGPYTASAGTITAQSSGSITYTAPATSQAVTVTDTADGSTWTLAVTGGSTVFPVFTSGTITPARRHAVGYKPGDALAEEFTTRNPTTGAGSDADSLPTAVLAHNGVDDVAVPLTVAKVATGRYKVTGTIPSGYAAGASCQVAATAVVGGVTDTVVAASFILDGKRVSDLNDAPALTGPQSAGLVALSDFAGAGVKGTVAASPAPSTSSFTVNFSGTVNAADLVGLLCRDTGTKSPASAFVGSATQVSANVVTLGFASGALFPEAPAAADTVVLF